MDIQSMKFYSSNTNNKKYKRFLASILNNGGKPCFYSKKEAQTPRGRIWQVWGVLGVEKMVGGGPECLNEGMPPILRYPTWFGKPLSPLTTSSKWQNHPPWVNSPPFCGSDLDPLLWWLKMLLYAHNVPNNILNNFDTSETSPRQSAFDLGIRFSPIFPFIWPSESFWRGNPN